MSKWNDRLLLFQNGDGASGTSPQISTPRKFTSTVAGRHDEFQQRNAQECSNCLQDCIGESSLLAGR